MLPISKYNLLLLEIANRKDNNPRIPLSEEKINPNYTEEHFWDNTLELNKKF